jgi:hypothetical protein
VPLLIDYLLHNVADYFILSKLFAWGKLARLEIGERERELAFASRAKLSVTQARTLRKMRTMAKYL